MICLLCYEPNNESISLDGEQGRQWKVPIILYKHFRFCFDVSIRLKLILFIHFIVSLFWIVRSMSQVTVKFAQNVGVKHWHFMNFTCTSSRFTMQSTKQRTCSNYLTKQLKRSPMYPIWRAIRHSMTIGHFIVNQMNCPHIVHWVIFEHFQ